jgi:excinuclease UvrABC nuclease subunit
MSLRGAKRRSNLITLKFIQMKPGFVYIMTNKNNTVLYTGVTSNLPKEFMNIKGNFLN